MVTVNNNTISNTDIAVAINNLIQIQWANQLTVNVGNTVISDVHNCTCPSYQHGAVHAGLVGEGVLAVDQLVGIEVEVTARPGGGLVLPGNPPYLWDIGWMSITNADGMLEEHRITRAAFVWLPKSMELASSWTYTLNPEVEVRVTELTR